MNSVYETEVLLNSSFHLTNPYKYSLASGDTQRRGNRKRAMKSTAIVATEESETEDVEVEKDDAKHDSNSTASNEEVSVPSKPKRGRKPNRPPIVEDSGSEVEDKALKTETSSTRSSRSTPTREKGQQKPVTPSRIGGERGNKSIITGPRGGNRSSGRFNINTSTVEDDPEDPYAFKEPENVVENAEGHPE